jgi:hypothetical protein
VIPAIQSPQRNGHWKNDSDGFTVDRRHFTAVPAIGPYGDGEISPDILEVFDCVGFVSDGSDEAPFEDGGDDDCCEGCGDGFSEDWDAWEECVGDECDDDVEYHPSDHCCCIN